VKFYYNTRVRVTSGFYKGHTGYVHEHEEATLGCGQSEHRYRLNNLKTEEWFWESQLEVYHSP
jgi:hypothetical protein